MTKVDSKVNEYIWSFLFNKAFDWMYKSTYSIRKGIKIFDVETIFYAFKFMINCNHNIFFIYEASKIYKHSLGVTKIYTSATYDASHETNLVYHDT